MKQHNTTIVDGGENRPVIRVATGIDSTTVIAGFTIQNGWIGIDINGSSPTITNCVLTRNVGLSHFEIGAGIDCRYSSPIISNCSIVGNTAVVGLGDAYGILCQESSPTITNCTISDNAYCGGILCGWNSSPRITNNIITGNGGEWVYGGGISCLNTSPFITDNTITSNTAREGGGILCYGHSSPTISGNTIADNTASWGGGGILSRSASPFITGNTITGNTANGLGGGIYCEHTSSPTIHSCTVSSNNGDGVTCDGASNPEINYNNIVDNTGYGVQNLDSGVTVNADSNWWGCALGPSGVGPGTGDEVSEWVDYDPWLTESTGVTETVSQVSPVQFLLFHNCPNPFNAITQIKYALPKDCYVKLTIYNIVGQEIKPLVNEGQGVGYHECVWDGKDAASGIYFYRLQAGDFVQTRKMVLLK